MYMSLSNCKLNDKLYKESLRFRAIESAVDYVVEEFRRDPLHDDFTLWWGHTSIALLASDCFQTLLGLFCCL